MNKHINKVAVIGSGIMGSGIACHFANIGVEVLLLDIVPRELNEKEKAKGLTLNELRTLRKSYVYIILFILNTCSFLCLSMWLLNDLRIIFITYVLPLNDTSNLIPKILDIEIN